MKIKDDKWYEDKIQSIKKRKKFLHRIEDPKMRKKIKADLKREQRGAKRSRNHYLRKYINNEINNIKNGN